MILTKGTLFKLLIDPQNGVLSGKYDDKNFIVSSFKISPLRADFSDLSKKEIKVLGLLTSHPDGIKVNEIGKIISLKNEEVLDIIYSLASKSVCAITSKNGFFLVDFGKASKASKILEQLGYKNITSVQVYGTQEFLREDINVKGLRYTVKFIDKNTNEECKGYILKDLKNNVEKDLLCEKIQ